MYEPALNLDQLELSLPDAFYKERSVNGGTSSLGASRLLACIKAAVNPIPSKTASLASVPCLDVPSSVARKLLKPV